MNVSASLRNATISAQKARLVADLVRGLPAQQAVHFLQYTPKKAAAIVLKVLNSAIANAEHNEGADVDALRIGTICVDEGITLKRMMPRAKGRSNRISKRRCHIQVTVTTTPKAKARKERA